MSSFAIGFSPFYYSNESPSWYQITSAQPVHFAQMNLGSTLFGLYNACSYNAQEISCDYSMAISGLWQGMVMNLYSLATAFGRYTGGNASATGGSGYGAGNFGSLTGSGSGNASGSGTGSASGSGSTTGSGNTGDAALQAENDKLKKELEEKEKIIAEQQAKLDANGKKKE